MKPNDINAILNSDHTLPKTVGFHVLFCPETKFTTYGKNLGELLSKHPMNPKYNYYTSYNTFGHFKHHDKDVLGLNAVWLDFDCTNNNMRVDIFNTAIMDLLDLMQMPKPNHCIMSGHGFHFVWFFSTPRITHSPKFTRLWEKLETTIIKLGQEACKYLFANPNICDNSVKNPSRLMRVVGSYNNKHNDHILVRRVPEYESKQFYSMDYFVKEYMPIYHKHNNKHINKAQYNSHKYLSHRKKPHKKYHGSHNTVILNYDRYRDLKKLVKMRNGRCTGSRDTILFLIACQLIYIMPVTHIIRCVKSVNNLFSEPLPPQQIEDFTNEIKNFKDYKLHTNQYIIKKLSITTKEQNKLKKIKQSKHSTLRQHVINHVHRMKYLKYREIKVNRLHNKGYSYRKISKQIKISIATVSRIIKRNN